MSEPDDIPSSEASAGLHQASGGSSAEAPARRSTYVRSGIAALAVLVVIGLLINFFLLDRHTGSTMDGQEVAERISQGIQAATGATKPPQVACPESLPPRVTTFACTLKKGAGQVAVDVRRNGTTLTWDVTNRPAPVPPS